MNKYLSLFLICFVFLYFTSLASAQTVEELSDLGISDNNAFEFEQDAQNGIASPSKNRSHSELGTVGIMGNNVLVGPQCIDGEIHDDGTAENGYGWNSPPVVAEGTYLDPFTPSQYPYSYTQICIGWVQNQGNTTIDFNIVIYDDDGAGGSPGTLLASIPATATGVPGGLPGAFYDYDVTAQVPMVTEGSVYIGAEWNPASYVGFFVAVDETPTTPQQQGYSRSDGAAWGLISAGFVDYRALLVRAEGQGGDDLDPKSPENFTAYSDYTTPTEMLLTWTDPTEYNNGDPLTNFQIIISRNGSRAVIDSVASGTESYTDMGLTDGVFYSYEIWAKDVNDSTSSAVSEGWTAGGSPVPSPPTSFSITDPGGGMLRAYWVNPTDNIDGTPMDDLNEINLYEDGVFLATFSVSSGDTGVADSADFTPSGANLQYYVTAVDNESPPNESNPSNSAYPPFAAPYFEDFEGATVGTPGVLPVQWTNEQDDEFDWYVNAGGTVSGSTGPEVDHTTGTATGKYMYTESSSPNFPNLVAHLTTPFLDLSTVTSPGMAFWYHMHGATMGELHVDVYSGGVWNLDVMTPLIGQQQVNQTDPWLQAVVDLSAYAGSPIQVRFRGITGTSFTSDMAIDDVFLGSLAGDPVMTVMPKTVSDTLLVGATSMYTTTVSNQSTVPSTLNYTVTENPPVSWLSVSPTSGTLTSFQSDILDVTLDATGLTPGSYTTEVLVAGDDPANPEDTVSVSLQVNDAPVISVSPDTFDVSVANDTTATDTLTIYNTGSGPLDFDISIGGAIPELMYYKFNEVGGNQTENFAAPGTPVPQIANVLGLTMGGNGFEGSALVGNGSSSTSNYVDTGWPTNLGSDSWTISIWLNNVDIGTTLYYHFGDNTANSFRCFSGGVAGAGNLILRGGGLADVGVTGVAPGPSVVDFVYEASAGEVRAYLDGVLNNTVPQSGVSIIGTSNFKVGGYSTSIGLATGELMDEFKIYNRAIDVAARNAAPETSWLSTSPSSGTVVPGDSQKVVLLFDPSGLLGGDYDAKLVVNSNDPVSPEVEVGVHMFVEAEADIVAQPDSILFGMPVVVGVTDTLTLTVFNNGAGVLDVTNIASSNAVFSVSSSAFQVAPFDSMVVDVLFAPGIAGVETGTLTISSNDPDTPTLDIYVEGEGIDAPVVAVSPDTFDVVVPSDSMATDTLTISNNGSGPLFFDVSVEGVNSAARMDVIGDPSLRNANIISVGKPVPLSQLENLRIQLNPEFNNSQTDFNAPFIQNNSGLQQLNNYIEGEEVFGSNQNVFGPGGARGRGNLFHCTNSTNLLEHRLYLNMTANSDMQFLVYESPIVDGTYNLISVSEITSSGTGEGWYSSGSINVPLVAGMYYMIFPQWTQPANYYSENPVSPYPVPASFGELIAGVGWHVAPTYLIPPAATQSGTGYLGDPVAYYQTIVTGAGVDWLSLNPTSGTVPPSSSVDVVLTFDPSGLLGGDYYANIALTSNDPVSPQVDIGVHMFVAATPDISFNPDPLMLDTVFTNQSSETVGYVVNNGAGVLDVTDIVATNSIFTVDTTLFSVPPFDSIPITVSFTSANVGTENGWLLISSNDPDTPVDSVWVEATAIPEPLVGLTPGNIETTVGVDDSVEVFLNVENTGGSNLVWSVNTSYDPLVTLVRMGPVAAPLPEHLDFDPMALPSPSPRVSPEGFGDLLLHLSNLDSITGATSHLGVAYAEGHFWVTSSEAGSPPNWLHKIDESGNLVQSYSQSTTTWGWRDLAYDGRFLYASVTPAVEQIDPANGQPTGVQIPGPENPNRALAYDAATDHFWTVNFGGLLYEFDRNGTVIQSFPNPVSSYGAAWDMYTDGGPWLWLNAGVATGDTHHMDQVNPVTGQLTGVSIVGITGMIAGGLDMTSEMSLYPGLAVMVAIGQSTSLTVWELAEFVPWLFLNPTSGVISPGDNTDISVKVYGDTVNADTA
jgi:hypothetical protein